MLAAALVAICCVTSSFCNLHEDIRHSVRKYFVYLVFKSLQVIFKNCFSKYSKPGCQNGWNAVETCWLSFSGVHLQKHPLGSSRRRCQSQVCDFVPHLIRYFKTRSTMLKIVQHIYMYTCLKYIASHSIIAQGFDQHLKQRFY